ncbi:MAG TPA: hypothetical protein VGC39_01535 [Candidatus Methylacidiphilales bacterium]
MENTFHTPPPNPETLFLDLLATSVNEARETGQIISSPHEAYAFLADRLDQFWREVRRRNEPEVLLDLLVALATQCAMAADDLCVKQVIAENDNQEVL